jgi:membrane protein required for beta-lactamase induction
MRKKLIWMAPLAILGMVIFMWIGGSVVMLLWNWLAPTLFGLRLITFWQAIGLLALCRILFGGFGLGGGGHRNSRRRMEGRVRERMAERWEQMTPEEREKFRQGMRSCGGGQTTPLDSNPTA